MSELLRVVSPQGEVLAAFTAEHLLVAAGIEDVRGADDETLALFDDGARHLAGIAKEARETVGDELIRRLDRSGKWTRHVGEFTVKAPSPEAGTVKYDDEVLASALRVLVDNDLIDREAMDSAIEWVEPPAPAPFWRQKPGGIKALLKLGPAVRAAVESARVEVEPPARRVLVKRSA